MALLEEPELQLITHCPVDFTKFLGLIIFYSNISLSFKQSKIILNLLYMKKCKQLQQPEGVGAAGLGHLQLYGTKDMEAAGMNG